MKNGPANGGIRGWTWLAAALALTWGGPARGAEWVSYDSSHERKTSIYLAKVRL